MILRNLDAASMNHVFSEARLQELGELFGNHRMAEKITLPLAATGNKYDRNPDFASNRR
jgi:hypothetical protein